MSKCPSVCGGLASAQTTTPNRPPHPEGHFGHMPLSTHLLSKRAKMPTCAASVTYERHPGVTSGAWAGLLVLNTEYRLKYNRHMGI